MEAEVVAFSSGFNPFSIVAILLLLLVIVLWFVVASAAALRGDSTEPNRMAQMYGYTICVVAVIVGLTSFTSILGAAFDRAYPLQNEYGYGASLISFEAYKATAVRERAMMGPERSPPDTASDATLRARYNALVAERRNVTMYRTTKTFITSGALLLVAAVLFLTHWRWLRTISRSRPTV
jgi:uncharacterized membrane protein